MKVSSELRDNIFKIINDRLLGEDIHYLTTAHITNDIVTAISSLDSESTPAIKDSKYIKEKLREIAVLNEMVEASAKLLSDLSILDCPQCPFINNCPCKLSGGYTQKKCAEYLMGCLRGEAVRNL